MPRRRLLWKLFPSYLAITLVALASVVVFASLSFGNFYLDDTRLDLEATARLVAEHFAGGIEAADDAACRRLAKASSARITVVLSSGRVVGDSEEDSSMMDNHADRPEIIVALQSRASSSVRLNDTLGRT